MKAKSQIKKQKAVAPADKKALSTEAAEISWLQSSEFFRISNLARRISSESTPLKEFNSEF